MPITNRNGWGLVPSNRHSGLSLLNDMSFFDTPLTRMIREHDKLMESAFAHTPDALLTSEERFEKPRYQVISNDNEFKVAMDVPGVKEKDISVQLDKDDKYLTISGSRESKGEGYEFKSKFSQSFYLEPSVDVNKFTAELHNGVLEISAPKDMKRLEASRTIPIAVKNDIEVTNTAIESNK